MMQHNKREAAPAATDAAISITWTLWNLRGSSRASLIYRQNGQVKRRATAMAARDVQPA